MESIQQSFLHTCLNRPANVHCSQVNLVSVYVMRLVSSPNWQIQLDSFFNSPFAVLGALLSRQSKTSCLRKIQRGASLVSTRFHMMCPSTIDSKTTTKKEINNQWNESTSCNKKKIQFEYSMKQNCLNDCMRSTLIHFDKNNFWTTVFVLRLFSISYVCMYSPQIAHCSLDSPFQSQLPPPPPRFSRLTNSKNGALKSSPKMQST